MQVGVYCGHDRAARRQRWYHLSASEISKQQLSLAPPMNREDSIARIAAWFAEQDDGEFVRLPVTHPYAVTAAPAETRRFLYTTKYATVLHALEATGVTSTQVVGRCGLPNDRDVSWLRALAGDHPVLFLGDCDPVDLLIFVWLRLQLPIRHVGVSDSFIEKLGIRRGDSLTIPLSDSEQKALLLVAELCPDRTELVGSVCLALLNAGRKIEVEAAVHSATEMSLAEVIAAQ